MYKKKKKKHFAHRAAVNEAGRIRVGAHDGEGNKRANSGTTTVKAQ